MDHVTIGRNDPCWCHSGKKFKKCHYGREQKLPLKPHEIDKVLLQERERRDCCVSSSLKASCAGEIVKAHTITKTTSLKKISRDGHVYGFSISMQNLSKAKGALDPKLIGINEASTFTGFCKRHDNDLFADIEKMDFRATKRECFLHAYRSLIREYFVKRAVVNRLDFIASHLDFGRSPQEQQIIQEEFKAFSVGSRAGLIDLEINKKSFEQIMSNDKYDDLKSVVIKFGKIPSVLASGGKCPVYGFAGGSRLQNLNDLSKPSSGIYYNIFCSGDIGYCIFTWLENSDAVCRPFIRSLININPDELTNSLIIFLFATCENIYISPEWWETLGLSKKQALIARLALTANPTEDYKNGYLCTDGVFYDNWQVESITHLN